MSLRKELSLRHAEPPHYTVVEGPSMLGRCVVIRNAGGQTATVKAAWLVFAGGLAAAGADCWPGSFRKALHVAMATWK